MTALATAKQEEAKGLAPLSLKDAPSFIEAQFPVGRLSAEAYKEREAKQAQTLTALGAYWKGRKPLILVRAVILGVLLPATDDLRKDLDVFLKLMAMDDLAIARRFSGSAAEFARLFPSYADLLTETDGRRCRWREDLGKLERERRMAEAFATLPYSFDERLKHVRRPEECEDDNILSGVWPEINHHLGTLARSMTELVEQLGIARFGHRPKIADTFSGGGSIPFEAARIGCDSFASDLNPVACMLTWGAFNIIGATPERHAEIERAQESVAKIVNEEIAALGTEHDRHGNRAKNHLYVLETRCPKTGWMVPMAPSWEITKDWNVAARLVPDYATKRYDIEINTGVSAAAMHEAKAGTIQSGRLVHPMLDDARDAAELSTIRGDYKDAEGRNRNQLRFWEKSDISPRADDIYQERLYAIQWITKDSFGKGRQNTFFSSVSEDDLARERQIEAIVRENLALWQEQGLVPDMLIEPGEKTDEPIRTRGWTYWHHLFTPRQLLFFSILKRAQSLREPCIGFVDLCRLLDRSSRLPKWSKSNGSGGQPSNVFDNQALNTQFNFGTYASTNLLNLFVRTRARNPVRHTTVRCSDARRHDCETDVFVTDPPYADAINYHEITEFFIAWLRKNPPAPFNEWKWDSQRNSAIKGKDEEFRRDMVAAYSAMTKHMPENGSQVVMFTHQDAGVWADLGSVLWASGLRVTGAWNIVTEIEKTSGSGNYVQGTVCLVLRKRLKEANARRMEIEAEIEDGVRAQLDRLNALDEAWTAETLYTDGDLTLAAYAAALQVVTSYSTIDRQPLDRDLYRKLAKGERTMIRDLVDYAAQVANGMLVPTDFPRDMWRDLGAPERFYVRMLDMEAKGSTKVADFQNFAKSFAFGDYASVMASTTANAAALAGAADLKGAKLGGEGFFATQLRQVLFAVWKTLEKGDPKLGVTTLRTEYAADYWQRRQKLIALAAYVAAKTKHIRPEESSAAHELAEALKLDRV
ncbi:DUF1156 domain-containing protein [Mesorhizobium sp. M0166]|uniref:anti-phage-associated DUF1156 domain-containing protein n=1 Tax=Mesorhizobium sp. M0166 TaxID=2956902 RepID=UPI003338A8B7